MNVVMSAGTNKHISLGLLLTCLFISCNASYEPKRAAGVPAEAIWAGGADGGGSWILCAPKDAARVRYACQVFNDFTGTVEASGEYVIRKVEWNRAQQKAEYSEVAPPQVLSFKSFDGRRISLADSMVLLPDGWIEFPFGDGHGKKRQYQAGVEIGETVAY